MLGSMLSISQKMMKQESMTIAARKGCADMAEIKTPKAHSAMPKRTAAKKRSTISLKGKMEKMHKTRGNKNGQLMIHIYTQKEDNHLE